MAKPIKKIKPHFLSSKVSRIVGRLKAAGKKSARFIERRPLAVITGLFLLTLGLIVLGNFLRKNTVEKTSEITYPSAVEVYRIGSVPKVRVQAKIEKGNVVKIVAQTSGIVQELPVAEGDSIYRGQTLVWLSTNYQGANAFSIQRQISEAQYKNVTDSLPLQKDLVEKQRKIAEKNATNSDELRAISEASVSETKALISLNEEIITTLDANLALYAATNSAGTNSSMITSTKQLKSQYLSGLNQLKSGLRNTEYQTDDTKPITELSTLQKETTLKQLELQEKSLELGVEISKLQYHLALITESLMYPASPIEGIVERVHVQKGQLVNPGTVLVTLSGSVTDVQAVALLPKDVAARVSRIEESDIFIGQNSLKALPFYVSAEATEGTLYSVIFKLEDAELLSVTDNEFVEVHIPVGYPDTSKSVPFIPLDSVYITNDNTTVFLVESGKARERRVVLGTVYGQLVEVSEGLKDRDQVILDRTVVAGDSVIPKK
ncbi:MAG: biotin/lipoyl-binding protein [Patescibacteria group bacterium]|jgi:multidrug efflux pump subunit AcrA (membrane-fusion protein)